MHSPIHTLVIEKDFFARSWMALLFARDWRTRLITEAEDLKSAQEYLQSTLERVNALLVDTDLAPTPRQLTALCAALDQSSAPAKVVWLSDQADPLVFDWLPARHCAGYLLKSEIRHSLAWALAVGMDNLALTPGTYAATLEKRFELPSHSVVLDGRRPPANLTEHESEVARLALIFSMERRDLADEMGISEDWSYGLVSALYKKLGLTEVLAGEVDPVDYLGASQIVNQHLREIIRQLQPAKKARDMETLAFHILTMPEVQELP